MACKSCGSLAEATLRKEYHMILNKILGDEMKFLSKPQRQEKINTIRGMIACLDWLLKDGSPPTSHIEKKFNKI
jgi:hypothetical protein